MKFWPKRKKSRKEKTKRTTKQILVEWFLVALLLFILASITPCNFISYRSRAYDAAAKADVKTAYMAAQAYYEEHPKGLVSLGLLQGYGFTPTASVEVLVLNGTQDGLSIQTSHKDGERIFWMDAGGTITGEKK